MPNTRDGEVLSQSSEGMKLVVRAKGSKKKSEFKDKQVSPLKFLAAGGDDKVPCKSCYQEVDSKGIQCDRCLSWLDLKCSGLKASHYKFLNENNIPGFKWFCKDCETEGESDKTDTNVQLVQQGAKIDNLGLLINTIQQQQIAMQQQNQVILEMLKSKNADSNLEDKIKVHVTEVIENKNEKEVIKNNLNFRNIPEDESDDDKVSATTDINSVKNILNFLHPDMSVESLDRHTVTRCGKVRRPPGSTPRPIKVTLKSEEDKVQVLKMEKKMKDYEPIKRVRICRDKTRKEQEEDKKLHLACEQKRKETGKDYIRFRNEIVLREDIPMIIRNQKATGNIVVDSSVSDGARANVY